MKIEEARKHLKKNLNNWKKSKKDNGYMPEIMEEINTDYEAIETLLTAYEKEKEANKRLDKEAQGYLEELAGDGSMNIRRIQELEAELEKEKEKNSKAIGHIEACKTSLGNYILSPNETEYLLEILKEE